ncbi:glutamate racemase [Parvibaculum sp.]|uniref:glutamate racemase n=1 Tax=Parvibaculum sp. TaxID=2024848 RepID=UPI00320E3229
MSGGSGGKPVLVFDSGIGGLSVLAAIRKLMPTQRLVYVADDAAFPYGNWKEDELSAHIVRLMGELIATHDPAAVVIACNTASTLVLPPLRERFSIPFVGTVPAVKPAAEQTKTGVIAVLATPATIARDYTRKLIESFAQSAKVQLVAAPRLASIAEDLLRGQAIDREVIREEIAPCFVEIDGKRTDIVVLGCTHYPFLIDEMNAVAPWPVTWLDPAPAIARRLVAVLDGKIPGPDGESVALFTSGRPVPPRLAALLESDGLNPGS